MKSLQEGRMQPKKKKGNVNTPSIDHANHLYSLGMEVGFTHTVRVCV